VEVREGGNYGSVIHTCLRGDGNCEPNKPVSELNGDRLNNPEFIERGS
jgi:hypothetical protein